MGSYTLHNLSFDGKKLKRLYTFYLINARVSFLINLQKPLKIKHVLESIPFCPVYLESVIEVFQKQDDVEINKYENLFIIPLLINSR